MIGEIGLLPEDVARLIEEGIKKGGDGSGGTLVFAIAYGARQEIVRAVNRAVAAGKEVTEAQFCEFLDTAGLPDPDLLIRTGRERRLSNFLLFQSAYTEFYFSDKLFPDFSNRDLDAAFASYAARERRFGRIK